MEHGINSSSVVLHSSRALKRSTSRSLG